MLIIPKEGNLNGGGAGRHALRRQLRDHRIYVCSSNAVRSPVILLKETVEIVGTNARADLQQHLFFEDVIIFTTESSSKGSALYVRVLVLVAWGGVG